MAYAGYSDAEIMARPRYALELIVNAGGGIVVSDQIRGKNLMTGLCNLYKDGYRLGVVYQLYEVDNNSTGLFSNTGTPLDPAVYLHNLSTILNDPGATKTTFTPAGLAVTVSGLPTSARWHLFQKSTGSWQVVVWNNVANWDNSARTPIVIPPATVTMNFPFQGTVNIYDPTTGVVATSTTNNTTTASISLTDHVIVVDYLQTSVTPVPTPPPPVPAPTPGGESVQGTTITAPGQPAIIDRLGNAWTLIPANGQQVAVNGVADPTTNDIHLLLYWNRRIYQEADAANNWFFKNIPSDAWTAATDPRVTPTPVPVPVPTPPPTPTPTPTPNPPSANFTIVNGQLIHPNGTVLDGRGMNFFDFDMQYARDFALPNLPKLNMIRLACQGGAGQNNFGADDVNAIRWFVDDMTSRNIIVIIEDHNTAQNLSNVDVPGEVAWLDQLARTFTSPFVWFGSSNEPTGNLPAEHAAVYNIVRNAGNNNMVVFGIAGGYTTGYDMDPATYRNMKNIVFDFHYYPWEPGDNASASAVLADFNSRISAIRNFTRSLDGVIPITIGEWDGVIGQAASGWDVMATVEASGIPSTFWWLGPGAIGMQIIDGRGPWTWSADGVGINVRDWIAAGVGPQPAPNTPTPTPTPTPAPVPTPTPAPYWDAGFGTVTAWMTHGNHQGADPWAFGFKGGGGGGFSESDGYWSDPPQDGTPATIQVSGTGIRLGCIANNGGFTNMNGNPAACVSTIIVNFDFSGGLLRQYGYYEFSARLDNVRGFLLHWDIEDYNPWNEIDVDVWIDGSGGHHVMANDKTGNGVFANLTDVVVTQVHRYGLDWQSGWVRFYVDGVLRGSTGNNYNRPFGTYFLVDTATYTVHSNPIQSLPAYAYIDYYRVWNTKP